MIRHERPLFCPYCGQKVDPSTGLTEANGKLEIYRWTGIAPILIYMMIGWGLLLVPATWFWGKRGFVWVSALFILCVLSLSATSWIYHRRS